jgi:hypothetical protein
MSSPDGTLGPCVRIPLYAWMYTGIFVSSVFELSCVHRGLATGCKILSFILILKLEQARRHNPSK